jgi:hypothetical protein
VTAEERRYRLARARAIQYNALWQNWQWVAEGNRCRAAIRVCSNDQIVPLAALVNECDKRRDRWASLYNAAERRREELREMDKRMKEDTK